MGPAYQRAWSPVLRCALQAWANETGNDNETCREDGHGGEERQRLGRRRGHQPRRGGLVRIPAASSCRSSRMRSPVRRGLRRRRLRRIYLWIW